MSFEKWWMFINKLHTLGFVYSSILDYFVYEENSNLFSKMLQSSLLATMPQGLLKKLCNQKYEYEAVQSKYTSFIYNYMIFILVTEFYCCSFW